MERWSDEEVRRRVDLAQTLRDLWASGNDIASTGMVVSNETAMRLGDEVLELRARLARRREAGVEACAILDATATESALDAARRVVTERDEARAEVERLRAELAEARLDEREACAALCETLGDAAEQERDACCDDRSRSLHAGRMHGADECARAIRARGEGGAR